MDIEIIVSKALVFLLLSMIAMALFLLWREFIEWSKRNNIEEEKMRRIRENKNNLQQFKAYQEGKIRL